MMCRLVFIILLFVCIVIMSLVFVSIFIDNVCGYIFNDKGELICFKWILINYGKVISLDLFFVFNKVIVINVQNVVMMFGLIDVYGYLFGLGGNFLEVDLCDSKSMSQVV